MAITLDKNRVAAATADAHRLAAVDPEVAAMFAAVRAENERIRAEAAAAAELLELIREQSAEWIGDDVDGLTLTARGNLFGAWAYDDDYAYVRTGRIRYQDDDMDVVSEAVLTANLRRFAELGAAEYVRRSAAGQILIHLDPSDIQH